MTRYASQTSVSSEKSRAEIERTLARYGADQFAYGWDRDSAVIGFRMAARQIRFLLPLPAKDSPEFTHTPTRGNERHPDDAQREWEKACRQRWRALALVIKAKLEAVESGITTLEDEFLAHITLPDGRSVGSEILPRIAEAYETGRVTPLLPAPKDKS